GGRGGHRALRLRYDAQRLRGVPARPRGILSSTVFSSTWAVGGHSRGPGAGPGPVERLADEAAEHATGRNQMIARECQLRRVALAILGIERRAGPGIFAVRL